MSEETKVPEVRFDGFESNWDQFLLGDVLELIDGDRGVNYPKSTDFLKNGHTLFLSAENIKLTGFSDFKKQFITQSRSDLLGNGKVFLDDIIITSRGTVGNVVHMNEKIFETYPQIRINSGMLIIRNFKKLRNNTLFIEKYLKSHNGQNQINTLVFGSAQPQLTKKDILKFKLPLPTIDEQIKIGKFIELLETKVKLTSREIAELSKFKQAMLQKMFPKEGETVPEVRFDGFEGNWVQKTLGESGYTFTGLSGKSKNDFGHGSGKYVPYTNVFNNPITDINSLEKIEVDKTQNEVQYGDVFFTTSSETPEEVGMASVWKHNEGNIYLNSFCFGYRLIVNLNLDFFAYLLHSPMIRSQFQLLAQGISRFNISKTKAMDIKFLVPAKEEQELIGKYFYSLDQNIKIKQAELNKLKQFKQAMLDKMFV